MEREAARPKAAEVLAVRPRMGAAPAVSAGAVPRLQESVLGQGAGSGPIRHKEGVVTEESNREAFLARRRTMIGGSDIAGCLNIGWGCRRRVYLEKTGVEPLQPFHGSSATERGIFFEEMAAKFYAMKTGRKVRRPPGGASFQAIRDKDYPQLGVHSDFDIVASDDKPPGILSVKVPGLRAFAEAKREGSPRPEYLMQAQYEMSVRRREWASFALVNLELFDLVPYDMERDDDLIREARDSALDMWKRIEAGGPEPEKLDPTDRRCQQCPYRINCHLQALMDQANRGEQNAGPLPLDPSLAVLIGELEQRQALAEEADALVDESKLVLKEAMAEREAVEVPGDAASWRVYFRPQKGRESFQPKPFAAKVIQPLAQVATAMKAEVDAVAGAVTPEFVQKVGDLLTVVSRLPQEMAKYTSTGAPSRPLRVFQVGRREIGSHEQKQINPASE